GLWRYRREAWAWKAWKSWKRRALRSGLEPLRAFVRRLEPYLSGILAHCRWPLGTNLVEGINNKISHQAGGLRLPGRRLLLPEDPGGLPRTWVKNLLFGYPDSSVG